MPVTICVLRSPFIHGRYFVSVRNHSYRHGCGHSRPRPVYKAGRCAPIGTATPRKTPTRPNAGSAAFQPYIGQPAHAADRPRAPQCRKLFFQLSTKLVRHSGKPNRTQRLARIVVQAKKPSHAYGRSSRQRAPARTSQRLISGNLTTDNSHHLRPSIRKIKDTSKLLSLTFLNFPTKKSSTEKVFFTISCFNKLISLH